MKLARYLLYSFAFQFQFFTLCLIVYLQFILYISSTYIYEYYRYHYLGWVDTIISMINAQNPRQKIFLANRYNQQLDCNVRLSGVSDYHLIIKVISVRPSVLSIQRSKGSKQVLILDCSWQADGHYNTRLSLLFEIITTIEDYHLEDQGFGA